MLRIFFVIIISFLITTTAFSEFAPELIKKCKDATALVETFKSTGSAFCINKSGYFITNEHVIAKADDKLNIVVKPGEADQLVLPATIVCADKEMDLAILKVTTDVVLTTLELGNVDDLIETIPLAAFGYPLGKKLSLEVGEYPGVTVSLGHITSLRKSNGILQEIQLDASLNPGNSGGPVVTENGNVVGVVVAGMPGSGINFSIPVTKVTKLITTAYIKFNPAPIDATKTAQNTDFNITVDTMVPQPEKITVEMVVSTEKKEPRTYTATKTTDNNYKITIIPAPVKLGPKILLLDIIQENSNFKCNTIKRDIVIDGQKISLDMVSRIENGKQTSVTLVDGKVLTGELTGIEAIDIFWGKVNANVNLKSAKVISVSGADPILKQIDYQIVVKIGTTIIAKSAGTIPVI